MSEYPANTPEWMMRLENKKKRPHRLAHEIGAGAPCLSCGNACPGLDLHFWRKLCRNCKCRKEDHDVKDDEGYEQFEILLGAGGRKRKTGGVLKIKVPEEVKSVVPEPSNKGVAFDWVPPNVSEDVAAEYMRQLPAGKLPISGSDGALYRRQQLEKQVPLHDLDASRCDNLTPEEIEGLKKYLENLKSNVVGQGCVSKVPLLYAETRVIMSGVPQFSSCGRALASSQSADSIHTLPPIPSAYNSVPRPFHARVTGDEDDDFPPPPLPDSLPPGSATDLKTPSAYIPAWTLQHHKPTKQDITEESGVSVTFAAPGSRVVSKDGSHTVYSSGVPGHDAQYSGLISATGQPQDAKFSIIYHGQDVAHSGSHSGQLGQFSKLLSDVKTPLDSDLRNTKLSSAQSCTFPEDSVSVTFAAPGHRVVSKDGSHTTYSAGVSGHEAQYSGLIGAVGHPHDANLSALYHSQDLAHSGSVPGQKGQFSKPFRDAQNSLNSNVSETNPSSAQCFTLPTDDTPVPFAGLGRRVVSKDGNQTLYSSGIPGQEAHYSGLIGPSGLPQDASLSALYHGQDLSHSSAVSKQPGQFSTPLLRNARGPEGSGVVYSTVVHGQRAHAPHCKAGLETETTGTIPSDGTLCMCTFPQGVAHSSAAPGQVAPGWGKPGPENAGGTKSEAISGSRCPTGIAGQLPGISGDRTTGLGGAPHDGTLSGLHPNAAVASSDAVPGQKFPGTEAFRGDSGSNTLPGRPRGANIQYGSVTSGLPGSSTAPLPLDGMMTSSLHPKSIASSAAVGTDAMPKSAQVMQQSHPALEHLTGQMAHLSAGEDGALPPVGTEALHLDCHECAMPVHAGEVAVFAERAGENVAWHPSCFVCSTCKELLVDLIYFFNKCNVYCGRHFAELLSIPRCFACDELIFVKEYTVAEGKAFHVKHFCCYECDEPLGGKQYVPVEEQPVCLDCFQNKYGKRCHTCKKQIAAGAQRVGWKELSWHVEGDCFRCFQCSQSLLGGRFVVKDNQPFCSKECVQAAYAAKSIAT